ncbi:MAG: acyltransferase [Planctomycetota bacterium]
MRFHGFDYLRAAGMLAVVYIHGCDTNEFARRGMKWLGFAVPCFFMMSAFLAQLSILKKPQLGFGELLTSRLKRLAPPFLLWSGLYVAVRFAKSKATGAELNSTLTGVVFWGDASHQLYFVPMLIYLFVGWAGVMVLARRLPGVAMLTCAAGVLAAVLLESTIQTAMPANRWFVSVNLVWFPAAMLVALLVRRDWFQTKWLFWPAVVSTVAMFLGDVVNVYWIAFSALALALSIDRPAPSWVGFLSKYSFGVYLVHVLLIEGMQFAAPRLRLDPTSLWTTGPIIVFAAIGSYAMCALLGRFNATRWSVT